MAKAQRNRIDTSGIKDQAVRAALDAVIALLREPSVKPGTPGGAALTVLTENIKLVGDSILLSGAPVTAKPDGTVTVGPERTLHSLVLPKSAAAGATGTGADGKAGSDAFQDHSHQGKGSGGVIPTWYGEP